MKAAEFVIRKKLKILKVLGNIVLLVVSTSITFLVLECGSRLFYQPSATRMSLNVTYYEKDKTVGWLPKKNITGVHQLTGSFGTTFRTNSDGLRDREYSLEKPKGVKRILIVGDSFTWGWGVGDDEIYTEVLESLLSNVEVINLGVAAFDTQQEFDYLKMNLRL